MIWSLQYKKQRVKFCTEVWTRVSWVRAHFWLRFYVCSAVEIFFAWCKIICKNVWTNRRKLWKIALGFFKLFTEIFVVFSQFGKCSLVISIIYKKYKIYFWRIRMDTLKKRYLWHTRLNHSKMASYGLFWILGM